MQSTQCQATDCDRPARERRRECAMHSSRRLRRGSHSLPSLWERLNSFTNQCGPTPLHRPDLGACWIFTGAKVGGGYGIIALGDGTMRVAHRVSYELYVGPIPEGLVLDHLCVVPACVNPGHLEPVTQRENLRRRDAYHGMATALDACKNGHPFDEKNTSYTGPNKEWRVCRTCKRESRAQYVARKREQNEGTH
jgi:hypothetical protein